MEAKQLRLAEQAAVGQSKVFVDEGLMEDGGLWCECSIDLTLVPCCGLGTGNSRKILLCLQDTCVAPFRKRQHEEYLILLLLWSWPEPRLQAGLGSDDSCSQVPACCCDSVCTC